MLLRKQTTAEVQEYHRQGWYRCQWGLEPEIQRELRDSVRRICAMRRPEVVYEGDGTSVRALHGCHLFDDACARLVRHPRLVELAEAVLDDQVYVYQFKVNIKSPRQGRRWPWHQDFAFWSIEDGMPEPRAVNIAINLDEVHQHNGPLTVLTGSHRIGLIEPPPAARSGGDWREHVSATLSHQVAEERVLELAERYPADLLLGPAGTVTAFHPNVVHCSSDNRSADRRSMLFITYNSVHNQPSRTSRPEFLVGTDTRPVMPLAAQHALLSEER